jgi:hypothetical protein
VIEFKLGSRPLHRGGKRFRHPRGDHPCGHSPPTSSCIRGGADICRAGEASACPTSFGGRVGPRNSSRRRDFECGVARRFDLAPRPPIPLGRGKSGRASVR